RKLTHRTNGKSARGSNAANGRARCLRNPALSALRRSRGELFFWLISQSYSNRGLKSIQGSDGIGPLSRNANGCAMLNAQLQQGDEALPVGNRAIMAHLDISLKALC